jgi:hypothetical protein
LDVGEAAFAVGFNAGDAARVKCDRSVAQQREAKSKLKATIGSAMFNSSSLASQAREIATSAPMIWKQTWLTTSGITGFTLPGMMEEPGCIGARWSSYNLQRGPDESQRKIVADFGELHCGSFHHAAHQRELAGILRSLDQIPSQRNGQAANFRETLRAKLGTAERAVDAGTDGGRAHIDLQQFRAGLFQVTNAVIDHHRVGTKLLFQVSSVRRPDFPCGSFSSSQQIRQPYF